MVNNTETVAVILKKLEESTYSKSKKEDTNIWIKNYRSKEIYVN